MCCARWVLFKLTAHPCLTLTDPHTHALLQICRDLNPGTLLAISQVSKLVHCTIASKSAAKLWAFVRDNAGLPDLNEPPPEPKYAHLAQGYVCQVCAPSALVTDISATPQVDRLCASRRAGHRAV